MVWSQDGRQPLEEEIFDGRGDGVDGDVKLLDVEGVVLVEPLEEQLHVRAVSRNPVEAFGVQTFLLDEGYGLLEEDRNRIVR